MTNSLLPFLHVFFQIDLYKVCTKPIWLPTDRIGQRKFISIVVATTDVNEYGSYDGPEDRSGEQKSNRSFASDFISFLCLEIESEDKMACPRNDILRLAERWASPSMQPQFRTLRVMKNGDCEIYFI